MTNNSNFNNSFQNTNCNEQINIIDEIINQMKNNINLIQTLKNNITNINDNNSIHDIDLVYLLDNSIKSKSLSK